MNTNTINNTKAQEYKRMVSRLKAINTYFNNQAEIAPTDADRDFCNIAVDNIGTALKVLEVSHAVIFGGTENV